jgi:hypothetical protein
VVGAVNEWRQKWAVSFLAAKVVHIGGTATCWPPFSLVHFENEERSSGLRRLSPPILWTFTETSLLVKFETAVIRVTVGCGEIVLTDTQLDIATTTVSYYFKIMQCN